MTFTAQEVAPRWRVSPEDALDFLQVFEANGLVARVSDRWQVTREGMQVSSGLALWNPHWDVRDDSRPARHRRRALA